MTSANYDVTRINEILSDISPNSKPFTAHDLIDWDLDGTETDDTLDSMVRDLISDLRTEECENRYNTLVREDNEEEQAWHEEMYGHYDM